MVRPWSSCTAGDWRTGPTRMRSPSSPGVGCGSTHPRCQASGVVPTCRTASSAWTAMLGGGVPIRTAHDWPAQVRQVVLVNSIGGSAWSNSRGVVVAMRHRPLWDWGLHLQADLLPQRQIMRVLQVILRDAIPNLISNPRAVWNVANLARTADLTGELEELKRRRLPVVVVWSNQDNVIPAAATQSLRAALGDPHSVTVEGNHAWLLSD